MSDTEHKDEFDEFLITVIPSGDRKVHVLLEQRERCCVTVLNAMLCEGPEAQFQPDSEAESAIQAILKVQCYVVHTVKFLQVVRPREQPSTSRLRRQAAKRAEEVIADIAKHAGRGCTRCNGKAM